MKIAFVGINILKENVIAALSNKEEVVVFESVEENKNKKTNYKSIIIEYRTFGINFLITTFKLQLSPPSQIKNLKSSLNKENPDTIIVFDFFRFYFFQVCQYVKENSQCRLHLYAETQRWPKNFLAKLGMKYFFWYLKKNINNVNTIFVFTTQSKIFFEENIPNARVVLAPIPVDTKNFRPVVERVWLPNRTLRILMNARYVNYKRHEDLLRAAHLLKKKSKSFHIGFIGRADQGRKNIESLVTVLNLGSNVTFLDPVAPGSLPSIYGQYDTLVLPSDNEALGLVVPEAMACGIPTITSDSVGANVYVKEGETGLIYPTGDVAKLANAIEQIADKKKLQKMGAASQRRLVKYFNLSACKGVFSASIED